MRSVRLAPEMMERLQTLADKTGRTKSFYAREAILRYLEDMEDTFIAIEPGKVPRIGAVPRHGGCYAN